MTKSEKIARDEKERIIKILLDRAKEAHDKEQYAERDRYHGAAFLVKNT